jgi:hypothetical protein
MVDLVYHVMVNNTLVRTSSRCGLVAALVSVIADSPGFNGTYSCT